MEFDEEFREWKAPGSFLVEGEASTNKKTTISNKQPAGDTYEPVDITDEPLVAASGSLAAAFDHLPDGFVCKSTDLKAKVPTTSPDMKEPNMPSPSE